MTPVTDAHGNLHDAQGRFGEKHNSRPRSMPPAAARPRATPNFTEARSFLSSLREGQPVTITIDGRAQDVTVQHGLRSGDPGGFGHPDSAKVTVGYGPGRWNVEVSAASLAAGHQQLERRQVRSALLGDDGQATAQTVLRYLDDFGGDGEPLSLGEKAYIDTQVNRRIVVEPMIWPAGDAQGAERTRVRMASITRPQDSVEIGLFADRAEAAEAIAYWINTNGLAATMEDTE